jgi:hypothetical protein
MINIDSLKKCYSYQLDGSIIGIKDLSDVAIPCCTSEGIRLLKIDNNSLELIKSIPFKIKGCKYAIEQNENIIFTKGVKEFKICDNDFNLIKRYKESK